MVEDTRARSVWQVGQIEGAKRLGDPLANLFEEHPDGDARRTAHRGHGDVGDLNRNAFAGGIRGKVVDCGVRESVAPRLLGVRLRAFPGEFLLTFAERKPAGAVSAAQHRMNVDFLSLWKPVRRSAAEELRLELWFLRRPEGNISA